MAHTEAARPELTLKGRVARDGAARKVCRYTLDPSPSGLVTVREFIRTSLQAFPPDDCQVFDIVFATHEACKNAVQHNPSSDSPVDVVCEVLEDSVVVVVADRGGGFNQPKPPEGPPDPYSLSGRGMFIISALMDAVEAEVCESGTRITMQKMFGPAA